MKVTAERLTGIYLTKALLKKAYDLEDSKMSYKLLYKRGHSIERSILFKITMVDIPSFVSVHLVRHSGVGQFHLVSSNREDWNPDVTPESVNRLTPVTHQMILNASHLKSMAGVRLCGSSHIQTVGVMEMIKEAVSKIDPWLAPWMVPKCWSAGGHCDEVKCCGKVHSCGDFVDWREACK